MSDWVSHETFQLENGVKAKIQLSKYTQAIKCAAPDCNVILIWNSNGGEDDDLEFRATSCKCGEKEYYTLCCLEHKNTYICKECAEQSE